MNRCPITYTECEGRYSQQGIKKLLSTLNDLEDLPFSAEEQRRESVLRAGKMSIQGVQAKLSAVVNRAKSGFEIVDKNGRYILKPQSANYPELPQNEDLTMRLASILGITVPFHGMVYSKDNSLTYFIKRFDRKGHGEKLAMEDFAQLTEKSRETKYNSSMETVAKTIEKYCSFPILEKKKLFILTLFNFICGNEDMHLKNFSLITDDGKTMLSPAYDLLNTSIVLRNPMEIALPIKGKMKKLNKNLLVDYFGQEYLGLNSNVIADILKLIKIKRPSMEKMIGQSFLSAEMKAKYLDLFETRLSLLGC